MISKKQVEKYIIKKNKPNSLLSHISMVFSRDIGYQGEINNDKILLWHYCFQTGFSHPVIHLKFNRDGLLEKVATEKNPIIKAMSIFIITAISIFMVHRFIQHEFRQAIFQNTIILVLLLLGRLLHKKITNFEKKDALKQLEKRMLEIEQSLLN